MSLFVVLAFLALSLLAYVLCGGADFGVGILELFSRTPARRQELRRTGERAIAPIWEANHVWIIVALVILFVGFPAIHVALTTYLGIPMLIMLGGIVIRGTAFTFRYYDVDEDRATERVWSALFRIGSLIVPLLFGHLAAAMSRGQLPQAPKGVLDAYFAPWLGWFPLATGIFTTVIFAWLAAVFLTGELSGEARKSMVRKARWLTLGTVVSGGVVSFTALLEGVPWFLDGFGKPAVYAAVVCATVAVVCLWFNLPSAHAWRTRIFTGAVVTSILGGYWGAVYPVGLELRERAPLTWHAAAAPTASLDALAWALVVAALLVLPALVWLYKLFKGATPDPA